jgi:hypothetical protein
MDSPRLDSILDPIGRDIRNDVGLWENTCDVRVPRNDNEGVIPTGQREARAGEVLDLMQSIIHSKPLAKIIHFIRHLYQCPLALDSLTLQMTYIHRGRQQSVI